ncbi:MAG: hypothetical protein ACYC48_00565 [Minisyncoccota bacterium]
MLEEEIVFPPRETPPEKPAPLFSAIATTTLGATGGKKTSECFPKPRYANRDNDFDNWLSKDQPGTGPCVITTLGLNKSWTFMEAANTILGVTETDPKLLGRLLIERGHTMTPQQVEEMVEKTERGEETKMLTNGYGNFFFVETGNENNPVSVGDVHRGGRDWRADVSRLGHGPRWRAGARFLLRNLDTPKL